MKLVTPRTSLAPLLAVLALAPAAAMAGPVATSDPEYQGSTRVFPDPQGGCNSGPCSPQAQGTVPAVLAASPSLSPSLPSSVQTSM